MLISLLVDECYVEPIFLSALAGKCPSLVRTLVLVEEAPSGRVRALQTWRKLSWLAVRSLSSAIHSSEAFSTFARVYVSKLE